MVPLFRRSYDPSRVLAEHPPVLGHPYKRLVFDLACPPGAAHHGSIEVTRWPAVAPGALPAGAPAVTVVAAPYDYAGDDAGVWHVNFADPSLFGYYGSGLLAQDELQVAEHPVLGAIREALVAEHLPARTVDRDGAPTPILVAGVERRCALATEPDAAAGRPRGLYGNRFAAATADAIRAAVRVLEPPGRTNLIAIAAPRGGPGRYRTPELAGILTTATTGFAAAVAESARLWPGAPVELRTGFWGCGAFGGDRRVMVMLQLLAARLAGAARVRFHAVDDAGRADFDAGRAELDEVLAAGAPGEAAAAVIDRIGARGHAWGIGNGT